ncbi:MAG: hypothetical protein ACI8XZ_001915, partial [Gammaproteobacteria bacterium]
MRNQDKKYSKLQKYKNKLPFARLSNGAAFWVGILIRR